MKNENRVAGKNTKKGLRTMFPAYQHSRRTKIKTFKLTIYKAEGV